MLLAGCGGGGGSDSPAPTTPPAPVNNAPSISGTPATSVDEGSGYSFAPSAADADGDSLTFSVTNLPAWASFNAETGEISGTPSREHAGSYPDISISVSDGSLSRALPGFTVQVLAVRNITLAGKATDAPLVNAQVTTTVGQREFSASTDAQGNYSLPIVLRDTEYQPEDLLTLKARGTGEQTHIELISQVASFESLIEMASSEEQLAAGQWHRLNLTQLSTAKYLLASDKNNGSAATTYSLLEDLEEAVDAECIQTLSGLIKLLADHTAYPVPENKTTLSLWQNDENSTWEAAILWLNEQGLRDTDGNYAPTFALDLQEAITTTLNDSDVVPAITDEDLIGVHIIADAPQQGYVPSSGEVLELRADGSGTAYIEADKGGDLDAHQFEFSWIRDGNSVSLTFPERVEKESFSRSLNRETGSYSYQILADEYGFGQEVVNNVTANDDKIIWRPYLRRQTHTQTFQLMPNTNGYIWLAGEHQVSYRLDIPTGFVAGYLPEESPVSVKTLGIDKQLYVKVQEGLSEFEGSLANGQWALPVLYRLPWYEGTSFATQVTENENFHQDIVEVNGLPTTAELSQQQVIAEALSHQIKLTVGNDQYQYIPFASNDLLYAVLVNYSVGGELDKRVVRWMSKVNKPDDALSQITSEMITELPLGWRAVSQSHFGYWKSSEYNGDGLLIYDHLYVYQLEENNGLKVIDRDPYADISAPRFRVSEIYGDGSWEVNTDGKLVLGKDFYDSTTGLLKGYRFRYWTLLGGNEQDYLVIEEVKWFDDWNENGEIDPLEDGYLVFPHLKWLKKTDLSQWQEAWANTNLD
nr:putative Ig domain-containing protein [Bowmanella dokdonensis]